MEERLQKLLAAAGIASRRSCEELIAAGRVSVNGRKVTTPGVKADLETDDVRVDGKRVTPIVDHVYVALNKPLGYVATVKDRHAPHTIMDLVQGIGPRIYPVGRLDADSAGLILLTNDGEFTQKLTHPSHQVEKTYRVLARGEVPSFAAADLRQGVVLDDGMTAPATVEFVDYDRQHNVTVIDVTIHEGRNRQVRRMFDSIGYPVVALTRTRIGPIELKGLAPGSWRKLHPREVLDLLSSADAKPAALPQVPVDLPVEKLVTEGTGRTGRRTAARATSERAGSNRRDHPTGLGRGAASEKRRTAAPPELGSEAVSDPREDKLHQRWQTLRTAQATAPDGTSRAPVWSASKPAGRAAKPIANRKRKESGRA